MVDNVLVISIHAIYTDGQVNSTQFAFTTKCLIYDNILKSMIRHKPYSIKTDWWIDCRIYHTTPQRSYCRLHSSSR